MLDRSEHPDPSKLDKNKLSEVADMPSEAHHLAGGAGTGRFASA